MVWKILLEVLRKVSSPYFFNTLSFTNVNFFEINVILSFFGVFHDLELTEALETHTRAKEVSVM